MSKADIRLAFWINEDRDSETKPHLKGSKPVFIPEGEYWLNSWINSPNPETQKRINNFLATLAAENGTHPIITASLRPAEPRGPAVSPAAEPKTDVPF